MSVPTTLEPRVPEYMLRARMKYPRAYMPWDDDEDGRLRTLAQGGASRQEMSAALGRGPGGIGSRLRLLGLAPDDEPVRPPRKRAGLPVPRGDWVPPWRSTEPNPRWVRETAHFWGVDADSLEVALASLEEPEATVFSLCYGLPDRWAYTWRAVGEALGLAGRDAKRLLQRAEAEVLEVLTVHGATLEGLDLESTLARRAVRRRRSEADR